MKIFWNNKATIDFEKVNYDFVKLRETMEYGDFEEQIVITVNNPYQLKIRPEKQIAEILGLSRSQVKNLLDKGKMELKAKLPQFISISINACQFHMDKWIIGNKIYGGFAYGN